MTQMLLRQFQNKLIAAFLCIAAFANAQDLAFYQDKFKSFNEVSLLETEDVYITLQKGNVNVSVKSYEEFLIIDDKLRNVNVESIFYSEFVKLQNFEAYTLNKVNNKDKKIGHGNVLDKLLEQNNIFHSDTRMKYITYRDLEIGSKKVLSYSLKLEDPYLLHRFNFANYQPAVKKRFRLVVDQGIDMGYLLSNTKNLPIQFNNYTEKGKNILEWVVQDLPLYYFEDNMQPQNFVLPHINYYIKSYIVNGKKVNMLNSIDGLYSYYTNFIKDLNKEEDITLKTFTLDLVKDEKTEKDKVKKIYQWVQDEIKYVAFESGYDGFIPREASLIFERRFADCKDMSSLITTMCKYAGINNVYLTWIGTDSLPYTYNELPSPATDNHMIATYITQKDTIFLDGTDSYVKFGLPSSFTRGKEALIDFNGKYIIHKVPKLSFKENYTSEHIKINLENGVIKGSSKVVLTNYLRSDFVGRLKNIKQKEKQDLFKGLYEKGNNTFQLLNLKDYNLDDKQADYSFDYDFTIANHAIAIDKELYINLLLNETLENLKIDERRKNNFTLRTETTIENFIEFEIPKGYKVDFVPENSKNENEFASYSINYKVTKTHINLHFKVEIKQEVIPKNKFDVWNTLISDLKNRYLESVKLIKL